jgi:hypothetical protein
MAEYPYSASGGADFGGAAALAATKTYPVSGGGVFGGAAAFAKTKAYPVSGGAAFSGASTASRLFTLTGSVGIPTSSAMGLGGVVFAESEPGAGVPDFSLFINGVDRTAQTLRSRTPIRVAKELDRETADFTIFQNPAAWRPTPRQEVQIFKGTEKLFGGYVESVTEAFYKGKPAMELAVHCTDYGTIFHRRVLGVWYGQGNPAHSFVGIVLNDMMTKHLADTGVTWVQTWLPADNIGEELFNWITAAEALNRLAEKVNGAWRVDENRNLYFFPQDTGYTAAPFSIADDDGNVDRISVRTTLGKYVNRQGVRNSQDLQSAITESSVGDGVTIFFPTTYFIWAKPVVTVNSVEKTVVEFAQIQSLPYDFYYNEGSTSVVHNPSQARYTASDTIAVTYVAPLPKITWAEDAAGIAAYGLYENVEEIKDVPEYAALQTLATALKDQRSVVPKIVEVDTRRDGLRPGQLLTIGTTQPLIASSTFLIESVVGQEEPGGTFMRYQVTASRPPMRSGSATRFYSKLLERDKQPLDRVVERANWTLAGTIEGMNNPGLTVGVKSGIKTATKKGFLREVRLIFKSVVDGTLTTSDIEIDIFQGVASIFDPADRLIFPAGRQTEVVHWAFASDPLEVDVGDMFTIEILQADSSAKDGQLELVIVG